MQLQHLPTPGRLMQAVNILGDHCLQLSGRLHFRELHMRRIGLCIQRQHLILVKLVKLLCLSGQKGMTDDLLGRIFIFLMIQAVLAAEIRNTAFRGDPGAAEKHNIR